MQHKLKTRQEVEDGFKWSIEHMYPTEEDWLRNFELLIQEQESITAYQGKLGESADMLYSCFALRDALLEKAEKLYVYANLRMREDTTNPTYQAMAANAGRMLTELVALLSFIEPELLAVDSEKLEGFMEDERLQVYGQAVKDMVRLKAHILSPEMERFMAQVAEVAEGPGKIFGMLNDADLKFDPVENGEGREVELTHGNYITLLESADRKVREKAFKSYYKAYMAHKNTMAETYIASIKGDMFHAKARRYGSSLEAALSATNVPVGVYKNLIDTVHKHLPVFHEYVALRKKALGVAELHMYDLYVPLVKDVQMEIRYDQAQETIIKALAPLGEDYIKNLKGGFHNGWVDVYENVGKQSGAFSWGAYGCHPYVLMNYEDSIKSMSTLAHEMGHAMHSYYTYQNQPYVYGDYTIFLAEVASTVNEALLMEYLLKTTEDERVRQYLVNYYIEQFRSTLFRQTMFAEFEMLAHEKMEAGEALTAESLGECYRALNRKYYGPDIVLDTEIDYEWSRISHFYRAYYVYQYATGYSAAIALSKKILAGGQGVSDYLGLLKAGSSDYSINILKKAGVDMSRPEPVDLALSQFKALVDGFGQML